MEINTPPKRVPVFLRVLSILSLIYILLELVNRIKALFRGPVPPRQLNEFITRLSEGTPGNPSSRLITDRPQTGMVKQLQDQGEYYWADVMSKILNLSRYVNANFYMDSVINIGGYLIGLAGILFMLRGRKLGFHLYIVYNLITMISIYASAPASEIPVFYFLVWGSISCIFIFLYSRNLKFMDK